MINQNKNQKQFNIKIIVIFIILFLSLSIVFLNLRKNKTNKILKEHNITSNYWQWKNTGQNIKGKKGKKNVDVGIFKFWEKNIKIKQNNIIAVIDSGIEYENSKFKNKVIINKKEKIDNKDNDKNGYIDDVYGWDFYYNDNSIYDSYLHDYHGTYISNEIIKMDPSIKILCIKILNGSKGDAKDACKAMEYAIKRGAKIINCSWAFYENEKKMQKIIKENKDVLFVCAAGNYNLNLDEENIFPASYKYENVLSVGAIDNNGNIYECSGYGKSVDVMAPGVNVLVDLPEDDKEFIDGTSIATAYVSGEAAILKSVSKGKLSPQEIRKIIIRSCKHNKNLINKCNSGGYIDVYAAYKYIVKEEIS